MTYDYDLFTIGAGSGGVRASRLTALTGRKVAVAEEYRMGGTCVIRGCIPKKYMVYASEYAQSLHHMAGYGLTVDGVNYDHAHFMQGLHREVDRLSGIYRRNLANSGADIFDERAEIVDAHTVRLVKSGRTFTAERILVATGGRPTRPLDLQGQEFGITSNEIFQLDALPKRICIAGGGYIAVEFASIMHGLGVQTCLLYRGDLILRGFDADVRAHVHAEMTRKGVHVVTHAVFERIEKTADGLRCHLTNGERVDTDVVMFAIGREPATAGLGLDNAGVALNDKGAVIVDAHSRTNIPSIFALGDVTDRLNLTPVAIREAVAFVQTQYGGQPASFDFDNVPTAVFCQPHVGTVGMTEAEARRAFGAVDIYKTSFRPMKNILSGDEERAFMKLVVKADDGRVAGCHIVGPDAGEIIQAVAIAVKMGATKADFDRTCALHPSLAEELVLMREKWTPPV